MDKIYKVTTEGDCEGKTIKILGYCTGMQADIRHYFEDQKAYEIYLDEIPIVHVSAQSAIAKQSLVDRKRKLEDELKSINSQLK